MKQEWIERPEGGGIFALKLIRTFALLCGRTAARLVLYPITLYFLIRRGPERRASRAYLQRVTGSKASLWEVAKHIYCFAAVTLDRLFLLSERFKRFDIRTFGLDDLRNAWKQHHGVLVFGAHLGSFDALRVLATLREEVKVRVVIDLDHNLAMSKVLNALNPTLAASIINARQDGVLSALAIKEALDEQSLVTLLVERARPGNPVTTVDFLGAPAPFPPSWRWSTSASGRATTWWRCSCIPRACPCGSRPRRASPAAKRYVLSLRPRDCSTEATLDWRRPDWPRRQSIFTVQAMRLESFSRAS